MFYAKLFLLEPAAAVSYSEFNLRSRHSKKDNIVLTELLLGISTTSSSQSAQLQSVLAESAPIFCIADDFIASSAATEKK